MWFKAKLKPIALLIDRFEHETGGTEQQLLRLTRYLIDQRADVRIISLRSSCRLQKLVPEAPLEELGIHSLRSGKAVMRALRVGRQMAQQGVGVAHCWFNDSSMLWPPILHAFGMRTIVSRRDLGFWYTNGNLRWLRTIRSSVDVVVANSRAVKDQVVAREGYEASRIRVIPNGIWPLTESGWNIERSGEVDSRRLPLGRWIVAVCNLRPIKRIDLVVRAVALLAPKYPDLRLAVIGEDLGDTCGRLLLRNFAALATDLDVGGRVVFFGRQDVPGRFVQEADVCVLASDSEGLSNALIEYALAMRPIVCSDIPSNREVISDRNCGLLFIPGSARSMADAIDALLSDKEYAGRLARNAGEYARRNYSFERMAQSHHELYSNCRARRTGYDPNPT